MELAERAANLNLPVFPCHADKTPACPHGFKDAAIGESALALFQQWPGELIGLPTGAASGYDALDIDSTKHAEAKAWLAAAKLPETRQHQTKSGGFHYLFQHQPGLRNWTSRPVPGIDGRADGGYIILWPLAGFPHNGKPVSIWPADLLRQFEASHLAIPYAVEPPGPINDLKLAGVVNRVLGAVNGERNCILFWASCRFGEWINAGDIGTNESQSLLLHAAGRIGLDEGSAQRTITSGIARGKADGVPDR